MTAFERVADEVRRHGFALAVAAAGEDLLGKLERALPTPHSAAGAGIKSRGVRALLTKSAVLRALAEGPELLALARAVLGPAAAPVKGIFFDKTPDANWLVPWHQDLTITVRERRAAAGFGPWSVKEGFTHVQPPVAILAGIVALRIHLDDAGADNGALRVLPGTHARGRLESAAIAQLAATAAPVVCEARRGDVLVMRPLLLHASSPSAAPKARRVIHLEYAAGPLPAGLEWGG